MLKCVGATFTRDKRGNPGEMTLKYAEVSEETAKAMDERMARAFLKIIMDDIKEERRAARQK